jgi:hypothetical protein
VEGDICTSTPVTAVTFTRFKFRDVVRCMSSLKARSDKATKTTIRSSEFQQRERDFSLFHHVQIASGAHRGFYSVGALDATPQLSVSALTTCTVPTLPLLKTANQN